MRIFEHLRISDIREGPGVDTLTTRFQSPVGGMLMVTGPRGVRRLTRDVGNPHVEGARGADGTKIVEEARVDEDRGGGPWCVLEQLDEYLAGNRKGFSVELDLSEGTPFQRAVWRELLRIPHGKVATYGEIAARAGSPGGARAVGQACSANRVAIIVPCHRVVGAGGRWGGYGGGLDMKRALLKIEGLRDLGP